VFSAISKKKEAISKCNSFYQKKRTVTAGA
jgi:hypothetical protein